MGSATTATTNAVTEASEPRPESARPVLNMKGIEDLLEADPTIKLYSSLSPAARLTNRARTPVLPEAALVGALSALHRLANHEAGGIAARTTSSARSVTPAYRP